MTPTIRNTMWLMIISLLMLTACSGGFEVRITQVSPSPTPVPVRNSTSSATPLPGNLDEVVFVEDGREYHVGQLIPRDAIPPIYDPKFVSAEKAPYHADELVMGVEINGDARAYAVGIMRSHEIVNDEIGGTPALVTW